VTLKDMFGDEISAKQTALSMYCDERIIDGKQHPNGESWIYALLLIIPIHKKQEVLDVLHLHREDIQYYGELCFHRIDKSSSISKSTRLSKKWLEEVVNDSNKRFYFNMLGIRKDNLLFELFGPGTSPKGKYANIYNRFFRTAFLAAINSFFPSEEFETITIEEMFHDKQGLLESHDVFPWHLKQKVSSKHITFTASDICFIESNHNDEPLYKEESHFIQLADILVGAISHCLDLPTETSEGKNEVAQVILPLIKDILGNVYSNKTRFDYFRKYHISFFPSKKLTAIEFANDLERTHSGFFRIRPILLEEKLSRQQRFQFD